MIAERLEQSIKGQKPSWKNALTRAVISKIDSAFRLPSLNDVPDTFRDSEGKEYTVIKDPRYRIPIALPTGIYDMLSGISRNSLTSFRERKEAGKKYYEMLRKARSVPAKR